MKGLRYQARFPVDQLPWGSQSLENIAVAALDVITAFAVPNLNTSSVESLIFRVRLPAKSPWLAGHSVYFGNRS